MAVSEHWQYQGRQHHQWFGHGTAPKDGKGQAPAKPGSLFDPFSVGQRIDYATGSVVAHSPRNQRSRWDVRVGGTNQDSLIPSGQRSDSLWACGDAADCDSEEACFAGAEHVRIAD